MGSSVSDEEAQLFAMQMASASVLPMVLKAAIELDLLEIIGRGGEGLCYPHPKSLPSYQGLKTQRPT